MTDVALAAAGSSIAAATCADEHHPPENTLDGTESTFWMTTGLFPQELVIALPKEVSISKVRTVTSGVRRLGLEFSTQSSPKGFEKLFDVELADKGSAGKQIESHKVSRLKARFLKFVIGAGYADFATVFKIEVYSEGGI